ncbi:hypothetical protein KBZ00_32070 [Streptomyces sp. RK31]|uniref:hypothetical protein n=1 Tax=Streptomyces sp. RK31 TaxID=2824892 RepID=UPI001B3779B3|nr:hypothetical protein [Streptomyces sp. RK31]MBQ0975710.1 hypothetical protein [Streptomyces sp. RK31]
MGSKPSTAARTAAAMPKASGVDAVSVHATGTDAVPATGEITSTSSRFGMPHALVIIVCIATAAILAPPAMGVNDVLLLIAGAGAIGAGVVVTVVTTGRGTGSRISCAMRAYFTSGS